MSEEVESTVLPEKLLIDNPSDFRFHAAYMAYAEAFEHTEDPETKKELNQNITALQQEEIDYQTFYGKISRFRQTPENRYGRTRIKTQKKREWRRKSQKRERNQRHKK
jgi:hypothetical protein